jgi:GMP synthase-like glutamine amidotransferase
MARAAHRRHAAHVRILVLQHDDDKGLGLLEAGLLGADAELDVRRPGREPVELDGHAAVISLPGLANPPDDDPALDVVREVLTEALRRRRPILGVCLGAELLAEAAGGRTEPCTPEWGFRRVTLAPAAREDALLGGLPESVEVFQAHAYGLVPPVGAVTLATGGGLVQAYRLETPAWGLQFHPEAGETLIATVLPTVVEPLRRAGVQPDDVLADARRLTPAWESWTGDLARRFARIAAAA